MSYSTMHVAHADGDVHDYKEYRNGHGYALPAWEYLANKYIPRLPGEDDSKFHIRWWYTDACKAVWALAKDKRLETWELLVLHASFDHAVVEREHFHKLAAAFEHIGREYAKIKPECVNHYPAMANDIRTLPPEVQAICFTATSCGDNLWWAYDECECPNCGDSHRKEEGRPYNLKKDKSHWYVGKEQA